MSKVEFEDASKRLTEQLKLDENIDSAIMVYSPFTDDYWNASPKIVFCNYENYGYNEENFIKKQVKVSFNEFFLWISGCWLKQKLSYNQFSEQTKEFTKFIPDNDKEKKSKPNRTVKKSLIFVNALIERLNNQSLDIKGIKKYSSTKLCSAMKSFTYMNLRPTSGSESKQDTANTRYLVSKYPEYIKKIILALEADIFILSTEHATCLFNEYIFKEEIKAKLVKPLIFKRNTKIDKMHVFSVLHPACKEFSDDYFLKAVNEIAHKYNKI